MNTSYKPSYRRLAPLLVSLAALFAPLAAMAAAGDLYFSEPNRGTITRITPSGVASTIATGLHPFPLAFDVHGNLFVVDQQFGHSAPRVLKITPARAVTTLATLPANVLVGAVAFGANGNLYLTASNTDTGATSIDKLTPTGSLTTFVTGLINTGDLGFDLAGNLYLAEFTIKNGVVATGAGKITKISPAGIRTTFASGLNLPSGVAVDGAGDLWVSDQISGKLYFITAAGVRSVVTTVPGNPSDVVRDHLGTLYLTTASGVVKVANGVVTSLHAGTSPGYLAVEPGTAPVANISTRADVRVGQNVLIAGFIVRGTAPKPVLIRALGPTLGNFGVSGSLQDPVLQLFVGNTLIATNDDWAQAGNAGQIPAASRPPDPREAAILKTLNPGSYTAIVSGKNSSIGVGLAEVYDQNGATLSQLANVSTRGFVGTGDAVMIAGFINGGGNGTTQVLIRALGPTLSQFGVAGALANPRIALANANGVTVAANDNWKTSQPALVQATGYAPPRDAEAAILVQLPAGRYTATVSGSDGGTGAALVEVYNIQ